ATDVPQRFVIPPVVGVDLKPALPRACPSQVITWPIHVTNPGICVLDSVVVTAVSKPGHRFVSASIPRTGDATTCRFVITNLLAQRDSTINLVTQADPGLCVVPAFAESIFVGAKHLTGACSRTSPSDPLGLRPLV